MKNIVKYLLVVVFSFLYILIFIFIDNHLISLTALLGVIISSVIVLFISVILANITTKKIVEIIRKS